MEESVELPVRLLSFRANSIKSERTARIDFATLLSFYEKMLLIRSFEESLQAHYSNLELRGELHLSIGQEAVPVGVLSAARVDDAVAATYRCHGHAIMKGLTLREIAAEIYGKQTGACKGKGGHMHLTDEKGLFVTSAIVGGNIPLANGFAFAFKYLGTDRASVAFLGDGASNQGTFHESLNLAAALKVPTLFVIEDNQYAYSTPKSVSSSVSSLAVRGLAYDMPNFEVDGNDVIAVYLAARGALDIVRKGQPVLLVCLTYRLSPHVELVDAEGYRDEAEREAWRQRDPIARLEKLLLSKGAIDSRFAQEAKNRTRREAEEAVRFAIESPLPAVEDSLRHVYAGGG